MVSHAFNGLITPPASTMASVLMRSISSGLPATDPPIASPWPLMYFVSEWIDKSAPSGTGRDGGGYCVIRDSAPAVWDFGQRGNVGESLVGSAIVSVCNSLVF